MSKSLSYFKVVTFCLLHFALKILFHFASKSCYILRQKLLHFGLMLHFASKVVTFRVNVTFCVNCYILRRNTRAFCRHLLPAVLLRKLTNISELTQQDGRGKKTQTLCDKRDNNFV